MIPNKNERYSTPDGASVYNLKQNMNLFLQDLARLDQENLIKNPHLAYLDSVTGFPVDWNAVGFSGQTYTGSTLNFTLAASGYISQDISSRLLPNESYTCIVYTNAVTAGSIKLSVEGSAASQIFNTADSLEINSASVSATHSASTVKNIIQFTTNQTASAVQGPVYIQIKNISGASKNIIVRSTMVYRGDIELGGVPYYNINQKFLDDVQFDTGSGRWTIRNAGSSGYTTFLNSDDLLQTAEMSASFDSGVYHGAAVYKNNDGKYYAALAVSGVQSKFIGIADRVKNCVYVSGFANTATTAANQSDIYLSATVSGAVTTQVTSVQIGVSVGGYRIRLGVPSSNAQLLQNTKFESNKWKITNDGSTYQNIATENFVTASIPAVASAAVSALRADSAAIADNATTHIGFGVVNDSLAHGATDAGTASKIVARNVNGDFSANRVYANLTGLATSASLAINANTANYSTTAGSASTAGTCTGNAATASALVPGASVPAATTSSIGGFRYTITDTTTLNLFTT